MNCDCWSGAFSDAAGASTTEAQLFMMVMSMLWWLGIRQLMECRDELMMYLCTYVAEKTNPGYGICIDVPEQPSVVLAYTHACPFPVLPFPAVKFRAPEQC